MIHHARCPYDLANKGQMTERHHRVKTYSG